MYQVLLGITRYRRVYAQDLISAHPNSGHPGLPSTQLEPTMKPMGAKYSGCIQAHFWFDDYLSTSEAEPKWSKSFYQEDVLQAPHSALPGHHHWRRRRSRLRRKWGAWCWRSGLFWLRVLSTNLFSAIAHHCLASFSIAWYCRHRLWSRVCPLSAKKPITNPRSIKDFAITKHAFRKAGPGALGEFQPGVRPPNLLIVFFWVDSHL